LDASSKKHGFGSSSRRRRRRRRRGRLLVHG